MKTVTDFLQSVVSLEPTALIKFFVGAILLAITFEVLQKLLKSRIMQTAVGIMVVVGLLGVLLYPNACKKGIERFEQQVEKFLNAPESATKELYKEI